MNDKIVMVVLLYMIFAFCLGVVIGKAIKWGVTGSLCPHANWEIRGYGGAGWISKRCKDCGKVEIESE